jgi:predicted dehydrogenase
MTNVGMIGLGRMGLTHLSILRSRPGVDVRAVCDPSRAMTTALRAVLPLPAYHDAEEMLEREALDCVVISTPSDSHARLIRAALRQGLHVFTEKPFVLSADDGAAILGDLRARPAANQVGYVNRFNAVFREVKRLLDARVLGDLRSFSSEMHAATVLEEQRGTWRSSRATGGGCLYELGCHCIDLAIYLFGQPSRVASSVMQSVFSRDVDDLFCAQVAYDAGYSGVLAANWSDASYRKPTNVVRAFGSAGRLVADKHSYRVFLRADRPDLGLRSGWNTRYVTDLDDRVRFYVRGNEFTRQLDAFVDSVERRAADGVSTFEEAHKTDLTIAEVIRCATHPRAAPGGPPGASPAASARGLRATIEDLLRQVLRLHR